MIKNLFFKNKKDETRHFESKMYVNYKQLYISYPEIQGKQGDIFKIDDKYFVLMSVNKTNEMDYFKEGYSDIAEYRYYLGDLDKLFTHFFIKLNENLDNEYLSQTHHTSLKYKIPSMHELQNALSILDAFVLNTPFNDKCITAASVIEDCVKNYIYGGETK